jgi:hypothetical protein
MRRQTGKEWVKVRRNEGVANHIGPKPSTGIRRCSPRYYVEDIGKPLNSSF